MFCPDSVTPTELCHRVRQVLDSQHFVSLRNLDVTLDGDNLILAGCVPSFHERQLAVELCRHVAGVQRVIDRLVVPAVDPAVAARVVPRRPK